MTLNKQTGNMYPWVMYTWNAIRGECPHECLYCYMRRFKVGKLRLDEKCLNDNLSEGNFIFIGSSTDMWAEQVPSEWILKVLEHCQNFNNTYFFQTKNPERFLDFIPEFPVNVYLGTTIESNVHYPTITKAPSPEERMMVMSHINKPKMVSIEPILEFDLEKLTTYIEAISPEFVSIGADSRGHNLPEPSSEKVKMLIAELKKFTEVKIKKNLRRLM